MIKCLSKYVSCNVLEQLCKLYIRPHLDYRDIVYHRYDPCMSFDATKRFEQIQYSSALAITGAWKGTNSKALH